MSEPTTITRETPSSVEITRNARGTYQWSIKCYAPVGEEIRALDQAADLDARLTAMYGKGGEA